MPLWSVTNQKLRLPNVTMVGYKSEAPLPNATMVGYKSEAPPTECHNDRLQIRSSPYRMPQCSVTNQKLPLSNATMFRYKSEAPPTE